MADGSVVIESKMDNKQLATGLKDMQGKLSNTGDKMQKVGKNLTKKLTVPIAAAATGAVMMAADFDASMSEVQAISGATGGEMETLENLAREMGSTTKFSASEAADGLKYMALAGWETEEMSAALPAVLDLAAASGADLGTTSDIVTDALSAFGMEASDASGFADLLASASSNSNTNVEMMGESFKYVAPVMGALGVSADDTAMALGLMANAGIKGSQAGTQLRSIMTNLVEPTDKQAAAMERYGVEMVKNADGTIDLSGTMDNLRGTLGELDEEQQAQAASTIFGKEAMSGALAIVNASDEDYRKLTGATSDYNGAAKEMADTMQDNLKGSLTELKSALSEAAISLGKALIPTIEKAVEWIQDLVDWFNSLDDGTKETIVQVGLLVAAVGPLLFIMGKVVSVVGAVTGAIGGAGGLAAVLGFVASPAGLAVAAIGGIAIAGKKLYDHLNKESIPEVERFGDTVSEETQEAVGSFMDMAEGADVHLKELAWSQKEVTQEMADDMKEQQGAITNNLMEAIDDRHEKEIASNQEHFENIDILSEEQKQRIIEQTNGRFEEESAATQEGHDRINEIVQTAADEEREITHSEQQEILGIREEMTKQAVEVMSQNELEQKAILEKMEQNSGTITAREAAEVVQNATKKKDDVIAEANEQYDETVAWAIQQRDEAGTLSAEEAADVISEAEQKRDDSVSAAEEMHSDVVKEAKAQAGEHVDEVDWSTGEIKTKWESARDKVSTKVSEMGTAVRTKFDEMSSKVETKMDEISTWIDTNIVEGAKSIKDKAGEMASDLGTNLSEMASDASTKMDEVKTTISTGIDNAKTSISDKYQDFKDAGATIGGNIASGLRSKMSSVAEAASGLAGKIRGFLPFSPAKEGPLRDLDKLDFGGPIQDSIDRAIPNVQAEMTHLFKAPSMEFKGSRKSPTPSYSNSESGAPSFSGNINAVFEVDGRPFAKATAPYVSNEMEMIKKRKGK